MADSRTYIRLHDGITDHPKIDPLSDKAFRTHIDLLCWCSRHLTDGYVPDATWRKRGTPKVRGELLAAGLAESTDGGVRMHDYLEHQRSAAEVATLRKARQEAGKRGGKSKANGLAIAKQTPKQNRSKNVASTDTDTKTEENQVHIAPSVEDDPAFDAFWNTYPERRGKKLGKKGARAEWARLDEGQRERALTGAPHYAADVDGHAKDARNWLHEREFEEWQTPAEPTRQRSNGSTPYTNPSEHEFEDTRI